MKLYKSSITIILLLFITKCCFAIYNDDYYGDCNYINQDINSEPITIYTLTYSNKSNNIFISKNEIYNNSLTTLLYKINKKSNTNQFEFISITSNDSVLVQSMGQEPILISDTKNESFSYRWDKPLYHPFLTFQCNNTYSNITAITFSIYNYNSSLNNNNNNNSSNSNNSTSINILSVLSGSVVGVDNVKNFEHESNISINTDEIRQFKTSFDRVNLIHYTLIKEKEKSNYYLVVTNLNNNNGGGISKSYLLNTGLDFNSTGLSSFNGTLVLAGYDSNSNTTKYYQVLINLNTTENDSSTFLNSTSQNFINNTISVKLLFEQSIKVTNHIKSANSNYLLFYSNVSSKLLVYNLSSKKLNTYNMTIKGSPYKDNSIDDYESFVIQDMYASGGTPSISNTKLIMINNNNNNNSPISHKKVLIISIVVIGISLLLFGFLGFYIFYIRKNRINNNFKKIIETNNNKEKQYPDDNITILLKNYR